MDAAAGDADGDGDLDLVLAMEFESNVLLLNGGDGKFADASDRLPRNVHDSEDVEFADFDGDGDLDIVLVSEDDRADELYLNDGSGRFTDASERLPTDDVSNALAVIDLDGDGAVDLLTGNVGTNRALLNDGRGGFVDATDERWPQSAPSRTQDIELADVDGDGDLDVVAPSTEFPRAESSDAFVFTTDDEGRLSVARGSDLDVRDADGDGDVDARIVDGDGYRVFTNDGGRFTAVEPGTILPASVYGNGFDVEVADFDADGISDLFLCNRASMTGEAARSGGRQQLLLGRRTPD